MKTWTEVLPGVYADNPTVIVIKAPAAAVSSVMTAKDGTQLGVLEVDGQKFGLQVVYPQLAMYPAHAREFHRHRIEMATPAYVGPVADIPTELLTSDEFIPLVFLRDAMWRPYLHIRRYMNALTKRMKRLDVTN